MSFKFSLDNSHRQSFIFWSSIRGTQHAQTFLINSCSGKIVLTEPVLMPTASALSCTLTRRFCNTVFSTARQFSISSQTVSDGRPDLGSSSRLLLPWRNSAAQRLTVAYDGAYSPYRAVKCRLIWHFRGQALLLRVLHVVACDNVRDCVFLKDDLNRV